MSKEEILGNIRRNIIHTYDLPELTIEATQYDDKVLKFIEVMKFVGGDAVLLEEGEDINKRIQTIYPDAKVIASNIADISATVNPDTVETPNQLNGVDVAVIQGELGVAENGCVWLPQNVKEKALYFISETLIILLDRKKLVNNMHEAYRQIELNDHGFGVFISGPSKTADIEQALVVGAHGARGVTIILT